MYEPFVGSGTSIIAGEMTRCCVHALELDPAYVDVAVIRWQSFTGKTAVLEATGESVLTTMAERSDGSATCATKTATATKRQGWVFADLGPVNNGYSFLIEQVAASGGVHR